MDVQNIAHNIYINKLIKISGKNLDFKIKNKIKNSMVLFQKLSPHCLCVEDGSYPCHLL